MKKIAFISGAAFSSLTLLGFIFKNFHWPGASMMIMVGMVGLALVFIPSFAKYRYDKEG